MYSIYDISSGFSRFVKSVSSEEEAKNYCLFHNYNSLDLIWLKD